MHTSQIYNGGFGDTWSIPGLREAYDFVSKQLANWATVPGRIKAAMAKATALSAAAQTQGKTALAGKASEANSALAALESVYQSTQDKISGALKDLKAAGFGVVPLIVAGVLIVAAGTMLYVFKNLEYNERVLSDIEKGILPPSSLPGGSGFGGAVGGAVGDILKWGAIAGAGYLLYKNRGKLGGGSRSRRLRRAY